ncbi:copper resistance CopC family protein [Microbulbifer taiwanensis]|uniref:Copper resistance protein C n=1 Tax=Microbulbifer taiwanensis TaxID=986746 RepID=A0ABW1YK33_9GAMM|nr:copper resistance CopC family protein [Microbulbifer taiwanensis]
MFNSFAIAVALAVAIAFANPTFAHSTIKSTVPASGSVLPSSPTRVEITFNEPARLTRAVVVGADKVERRLEISPSGSATTFFLEQPALKRGRNEIRWKALSRDGHPIDGSIVLVIKADAIPSAALEQDRGH